MFDIQGALQREAERIHRERESAIAAAVAFVQHRHGIAVTEIDWRDVVRFADTHTITVTKENVTGLITIKSEKKNGISQ